ncbi:hypothetical protein BDV33DRAFT_202984 [Aspergillus novoparasiticus]|uniref:Uncharacterized protein n=1 Tax=Aspergillus novoparasiticus TaxID=986946 RepID=A0A5N6EUP2_9EURO|nr:hypothetical protein BDV33DRAFT_202984 [Aspergillus novoparasiticus]
MAVPSRQPINSRNRDQQRHSSFEKHSRDSFGDIVIMSLIQLNTMDLLFADPFSHAEVLMAGDSSTMSNPGVGRNALVQDEGDLVSAVRGRRESDPVVLDTDLLPLRVSSLLEHCGLRMVFRSDPRPGQMYQRVVYLAWEIEWDTKPIGSHASSCNSSLAGAPAEDDLAQLIICHDLSSGSYRLTLPAWRAAVDGTSLEIIKRNFILLYCGLPLLEYTSVAAYPRFLKETKDTTSSIAFWKAQLKDAMPPVALPWETGLSDIAIAYVS